MILFDFLKYQHFKSEYIYTHTMLILTYQSLGPVLAKSLFINFKIFA